MLHVRNDRDRDIDAETLQQRCELVGNHLLVVWCLERAAVLTARIGEPEAAIRILAAAEAPRRDIAVEADPGDQRLLAEALRRCEEALTAEEVAAEFGAGRAMILDDAVAEAQRALRRARALDASID